MPAGSAVVADLSGVVLASKGTPQILVTDSHANQFVRNEMTLLCEVAAAAFSASRRHYARSGATSCT